MKIMTILGTRPEIIRLSLIIQKLDRFCEHTLVHTGQNYDPALNDIFFQQLGLRQAESGTARSVDEAVQIAEGIGYPVMVRPSYVLGGRSMQIVYDRAGLLADHRVIIDLREA